MSKDRICPRCKESWPNDEEFFYRRTDGRLHSYCKACFSERMNQQSETWPRLLEAVKLAYRKHHLNDESISWDELSGELQNALCYALGEEGYQEWLEQATEEESI